MSLDSLYDRGLRSIYRDGIRRGKLALEPKYLTKDSVEPDDVEVMAIGALGTNKAQKWMETPHPRFDGHTPREACRNGDLREVVDELASIAFAKSD